MFYPHLSTPSTSNSAELYTLGSIFELNIRSTSHKLDLQSSSSSCSHIHACEDTRKTYSMGEVLRSSRGGRRQVTRLQVILPSPTHFCHLSFYIDLCSPNHIVSDIQYTTRNKWEKPPTGSPSKSVLLEYEPMRELGRLKNFRWTRQFGSCHVVHYLMWLKNPSLITS